MREVLSPVRAALRAGRKRRAAFVLAVLTIIILGLFAFGTFMDLRQQRRFLNEALQNGGFFGLSCDPGEIGGGSPEGPQQLQCRFMGPIGPIGPTISESEVPFLSKPEQPPPPNFDPGATERELFEKYRAQIEPEFRRQIREFEGAYAPRRLLVARTRMAATFWGVLFVVMFGSTLFGAEWRWSVWRTQLTHEPRRGRVFGAKIAALWVLVAAGYVIVLAAIYGLDQLFRVLFDVTARGGPGYRTLAAELARGLLPLEVYATMAAVAATIARASVVGLGAPLAVLLADGLLTNRFSQLRPFSAAQQVAWLIPNPQQGGGGPFAVLAWWPKITSKFVCTGVPQIQEGGLVDACREIKLPPIPQGRAIAVLFAWMAVVLLAAYGLLRARDVPQ